jgi:hypothetical protein
MAFARLFPIDATDTQDGNRTVFESLLDERRAYQDRDCGAAEIQRFAENAPRWPDGGNPSRRSTDDLSGDFPTPSPPAKKASARRDETGQASTAMGPGTATPT